MTTAPARRAARRTAALVRPASVSAIKIVLARPRSVSRDAAWSVGRTDTVPVSRPASTTAARVAPRRSADTMAIAALGSVAWSGVALMIQAAADQTKTVPRISAAGVVAVSPSKAAASQTVTVAPIRRVRTGSASRATNRVSEATARRRLLRPSARAALPGCGTIRCFVRYRAGRARIVRWRRCVRPWSARLRAIASRRHARVDRCRRPRGKPVKTRPCAARASAPTPSRAHSVSAIVLVTTTAATPSRAWRWL